VRVLDNDGNTRDFVPVSREDDLRVRALLCGAGELLCRLLNRRRRSTGGTPVRDIVHLSFVSVQ
jgi:hypothetical protein